jgi:hypothetical protein
MSLLILYLLRHCLTTPGVKNVELSGILRKLRFEEVMMGWGSFFLHELDLKRIRIPEVPEEDSTALIREYKAPFKAKQLKGKEPAPSKLTTHHRTTTLCPWGEIISESRLVELINTVPGQFFKDLMYSSKASLRHPDSSLLFMSFTSEIWLLLGKQFLPDEVNVPTNLEAAMDIWSLKSIQQICNDVIIHPTHDLLKKMGPVERKKSEEVFGGKRRLFFPSRIDLDASPLKPLASHETSYLSRYHRVLRNQSAEETENLNTDLDDIFSKLQCLPAAMNERGKHTIWKTESGRVKFLVNSLYYRIKGISIEREACIRRRAQLTGPAFEKRVYEAMYIPYSFLKNIHLQRFHRYGRKSYKKRKRREEKSKVKPQKKRSTRLRIGRSLQRENENEDEDENENGDGRSSSEEIHVSDNSST